jgi:beta-glucanase (GH16 family)
MSPGGGAPAYAFDDEFDGPAGAPPDPARWSYDIGGGGWGNGELQAYTDSPVNAFQDGRSHLVIRATRQPASASGPDYAYHSARITTRDKFWQLGGSFEARIKVDSRRGVWPAFWLMGQDHETAGWPACGEVDVMEDFGYSTVQASVHAPAGGIELHSAHGDLPSDGGWHVYLLSWDTGGMTVSADGRPFLRVSRDFCPAPSWVFGPGRPHNGGMFLLLNLAVGGSVGDPPPDTEFPVDLMIDYVRVRAA